MMTKLSSSKIPIRDLKPMFNTMEHNQRSRKESFSAGFNPPASSAKADVRSKSAEKMQKISEKNKDLKHLINVKDREIHELRKNVSQLLEENEKFQRDRALLIDNYNSLMERAEESAGGEKSKIDALEKENSEMKNDLKMLKTLVFRLNKHIEYYQEILYEKEIKFEAPSTYDNEDETASTWTVHSNILSPLMNSYEERIKEKNEIIKSYEAELSQFTVKLKKILEENEKIQEIYETQMKNAAIWLIEKKRLTSQNEILHNKATIHVKRADLAKEKLFEFLKAYEQKVKSQSLDIERLQEAYNRSKSDIATLKRLQRNPDEFSEQLIEFQKMFEDFRIQFEGEKSQLVDEKRMLETQLCQLKDKVNELSIQTEKQKMCNEALIDKNKSLKKEVAHERQSRVNLEQESNQIRKYGQESWQSIVDLRNLVQEKENMIQNITFTHQKELEDYAFKLEEREAMLKKILKVKIAQQASTKI